MTVDESTRLLADLARRLRTNSDFMAHSLCVYRQQERLDESALAERLEADAEMVNRLALCKRPCLDSPLTLEQIQELADYTGIDGALIAEVIAADTQDAGAPGPLSSLLRSGTRWIQSAKRGLGRWAQWRPRLVTACVLLLLFGALVMYVFNIRNQPRSDMARDLTESPMSSDDGTSANSVDEPLEGPPSSRRASDEKQSTGGRLPRKSSQLIAKNSVRVSIDDYQTLREDSGRRVTEPLKLPRARTAITFELQEGSTPGAYEVRVKGAFGERLINREAVSRNGHTLRVTLDLQILEPKQYYLCVSQKDEIPDCVSIKIESESGESHRE
jgi:hypothetical protein